jgi:HD-like signal output (HDOD) protein
MKITLLFVGLDDLRAQIKTLPASPQLLPQLLRLISDPDSGLDELAKLVRSERSLAVRLIQIANGPVYRGEQPCTSIEEAVQRLGYLNLHRLVTTMLALDPLAKPLRAYQCTPTELWRQAIATACAARLIAALVSEEPNQAYLLGLTHNIGMVVIDRIIREKSAGIILNRAPGNEEWRAAEMNLLGFDQAEAGAQILQAWQFPPTSVKAIRTQFNPEAGGTCMRLAAVVLAARWVRSQTETPLADQQMPPASLVGLLGCDPNDLVTMIPQVVEEIGKVWESLGLSSPKAA